MVDTKANLLDRIDPEQALRPGNIDANLVLLLWCVRKSFYPLLWVGLSIAIIALGDIDAVGREFESLDSPQAIVSNLLSPFGIIVLAFGLRILGGFAGLAAAYPLTLSTRHHHYTGNRIAGWFRLWWDRLYQARAYRSLRQTWVVRDRAHQRLEATGRIYRICLIVLMWANVVFLITLFIVIGRRSPINPMTPPGFDEIQAI